MNAVIPAVVVGVVLLLASGAAAAKKRKKKTTKKKKAGFCVPNKECAPGKVFDPEAGECGECVDDKLPDVDEDCGPFTWFPDDVDKVGWILVDQGERNVMDLSVAVAEEVYPYRPDGQTPVEWPPPKTDEDARCIWERVLIRMNMILAEKADEEDEGEGEEEEEQEWEETPPPGPVDIEQWEHNKNFPEPNKFHQVYYQGANNSATTVKHIAQKAILQIVTKVTGDYEFAKVLADDPEIWRAYRELITCSPWNAALFAVKHTKGTGYYYDSPTGEQLSMNPLHDHVREALAEGYSPVRTVTGPQSHDGDGGAFAYFWLPPLDLNALIEDRVVRLDPEYWPNGFTKLLPPPEVLALIPDVPRDRYWGCPPDEMAFDMQQAEPGFHTEPSNGEHGFSVHEG